MKPHQALLEQIDAETARMWLTPPADVVNIFTGALVTDAGTGGQYFSVMDCANHEVRYFAEHGIPLIIKCSLRSGFSLPQCVSLARLVVGWRLDFADWMGLNSFVKLTRATVTILPELENIEDFRELAIGLERYTHKLQFWTTHYFPWGVGALFPHQDKVYWSARQKDLEAAAEGMPEVTAMPPAQAKATIDAETGRLFEQEPGDIRQLFGAYSVHGAGSFGQAFSTLCYVHQELRWAAEQGWPLAITLSTDDNFTIAQVRHVARTLLSFSLPFLHWMGLDDYPRLGALTLASMEEAETRGDLQQLLISMERYTHRLQGWACNNVPWGAGALFISSGASPGAIDRAGKARIPALYTSTTS